MSTKEFRSYKAPSGESVGVRKHVKERRRKMTKLVVTLPVQFEFEYDGAKEK
jgi:hypothetical protein